MRAWIVSDIHHSRLDVLQGRSLEIPDADVCICAGDVSDNMGVTITYLLQNIAPYMPVVVVFGNSDYCHFSIHRALERARHKVQGTRVHLLENQSIEIGSCRFVGATLWTNLATSLGGDDDIPPDARASRQMQEFLPIYRSDQRPADGNVMVTDREILGRHIESRKFIDRELEKFHDGPTIVLTHHAPIVEGFDTELNGQATNAAFGPTLSDLIRRRKPAAWIHGHSHEACDYIADGTRIICNPVGYPHERATAGFRPGLVIDL